MSRFNTQSPGTKTKNLAGGQAFSQTAELQLASLLLTNFAGDNFYRNSQGAFDELKKLIVKCDKKYVAKAAVLARTQFGMRSITHVVASELAKHISGQDWAKDFYNAIIYRPDDMIEILSYHTANNGKVPNSMKNGLAKAFDKFDRYSLAKYRADDKKVKLVDVANVVHPVPTSKNAEALKDLMSGKLKSFDTWESELTKAGQNAANDEEKAKLKKEVWARLLREEKLGYFALLRNLRNIIEQAPDCIDAAIIQLTDEKRIKHSLVLPFRYLTAFEEIQKLNDGQIVRKVLIALNKAVDISVSNVTKFDGDTLVVLDVSGSMESSSLGSKSPHIIGALFSAVLAKSNNADLITFSDNAKYRNINPMDSTITISNSLRFSNGGTNFHSIFQTANKKYDRIIILSDMQGWIGHDCPAAAFNDYKKATGADPYIYSFDLSGYGTMQFPERNVFALAGFSEKVFDIMQLMESEKNSLIKTVNNVAF